MFALTLGSESGAVNGISTILRQASLMPDYRRPKVPGAPVFFTVALADRSSDLLVREVARLRQAVRAVREERPFRVEAWVVLPDHMHAVWTLPEGDSKRRPGFSPAYACF